MMLRSGDLPVLEGMMPEYILNIKAALYSSSLLSSCIWVTPSYDSRVASSSLSYYYYYYYGYYCGPCKYMDIGHPS